MTPYGEPRPIGDRIHRGFHRLGILFIGVCGMLVALAIYGHGQVEPSDIHVIIGVAAVGYVLLRGIGWIVVGLLGR